MMKIPQTIIFLAAILSTPNVYGQYTSEKGWFEVDVINDCTGGCSGTIVRGCEGLQIIIRMTATSPCDCFAGIGCCDFSYLEENVFVVKPNPEQFTYTQAGNYRLQVLFERPNGPDFMDIQINDKTAPDFNIYSCAGRSIQVDIQDNQYNNYIINFGDGSPELEVPLGASNAEHNYANTVPRIVSVRGIDTNSADNCALTNDDLVPVNLIIPSSFDSLVSLTNDQLALYYNLQPDIQHRLEISVNDGAWTSFNALLEDTSEQDTIQNLDLENNFYCFRIRSIDPCAGSEVTSPVICNVLFNVAFEDNVNELNWSSPALGVIDDFEFRRNGGGSQLVRPGLTGTSSNDTDIDCDTEYCYVLNANYAAGFISKSLERCGTSFSTVPPEPVNNLTVSVEGNAIDLIWPENPAEPIAEYAISRGTNVNSLSTIARITEASFREENLIPDEISYCYRIDAVDECSNRNEDGVIACSMLLTGTISPDNTIRLDWNDYEGWENGLSNYTIEKSYLNTPAPAIVSAASELQEIDNNDAEQVIRYRIRANPIDNSLSEAFSNVLTIIKPNNIYYPNAFTPNRNNINETFTVNGKFMISYELNIFNRWGELVFTSDNPETGWDGTFEGKDLPLGTYVFKVEIIDQAGREIAKTGTVLLIR
ncbi:gliding motility-associated C-terminal domain-containing protein [Fulvivirga sp. M361]|uniref:T9SS type B sorting domain-containing protein n=1 Tax=Fulvivirga sp. M361 TaxID=2594266 RepID=UPI001179DB01|nr:gliding motility-associated C-terminal domain-containing protein [Fulvivirga sp. M361]TRX56008.1 gliding motility-associated C-terminal domain-containing protein [Fulvivirga sp. M361]